MTRRVTVKSVRDYLDTKVRELESNPGDLRPCDVADVRLLCAGILKKFDTPSFDRNGLETYVNEQLDWHIDALRMAGRQRRVRGEEKRHFAAAQDILYELLEQYGLKRIRTLY